MTPAISQAVPGTMQARAGRTDWRQTLRRALRRPQFWFGLLVIVPTVAFYVLFFFRPIIMAFPLSLQAYNVLYPAKSIWVGLYNFRSLFNTALTFISARNTLQWAAMTFAFTLPVCFAVAYLVANVSRWRTFYQGMIYLPNVISVVAIMLLFRMILDPQIGQVNALLNVFGLPGLKWLSDSDTAMVTLVLILTWKGMGGTVIILAAGLLNVPHELYEAAEIDGCNGWAKFWKMTLPLVSHTLLLITVLTAIGALQELSAPLLFTDGGPGQATTTYNLMLYNEAFKNLRFGVASAGALLQFAIILLLTLLQFKLLKPKWSY